MNTTATVEECRRERTEVNMESSSADQVDNLSDVKLWIAEHDGRINAWWVTQHRWNDKQEERIKELTAALTQLRVRVMWLVGAAAIGGAVVGALATKLII